MVFSLCLWNQKQEFVVAISRGFCVKSWDILKMNRTGPFSGDVHLFPHSDLETSK